MQKTTGAVIRTTSDLQRLIQAAGERYKQAVNNAWNTYQADMRAVQREADFGQGAAGDSQDARLERATPEADA